MIDFIEVKISPQLARQVSDGQSPGTICHDGQIISGKERTTSGLSVRAIASKNFFHHSHNSRTAQFPL